MSCIYERDLHCISKPHEHTTMCTTNRFYEPCKFSSAMVAYYCEFSCSDKLRSKNLRDCASAMHVSALGDKETKKWLLFSFFFLSFLNQWNVSNSNLDVLFLCLKRTFMNW